MMKTKTAPRRVYQRNDITHVLLSGQTFAPSGKNSRINVDKFVKLEAVGSKQVRVKQSKLTELWKAKLVPTKHR